MIEGTFTMGEKTYGPGTIVQDPGPTTGARPIYDGRMNLKAAPKPAEIDRELRAAGGPKPHPR